MDVLAFLLTQPLYLALLMLVAGGGVLAWPALSGGGRGVLKRRLRVEGPTMPAGDATRPASSALRQRAEKTAQEFYARTDPETVARLRLRLIQAGFMDPRAVGAFFLIRFLCLASAGLVAFLIAGIWGGGGQSNVWMFAGVAAIMGYFAPGLVLSRLVKQRVTEHRNGFPDFMDLMIVCADAGMSMEASIERVSRELALTYPSLSRNLHLITIELRAGRGLEDSLRSLADRLSLEEVRSFATLLQQSRELGTSLSGALRVFSDEMRHKRMSLAEEKAHALPAKMSIPVTVCILPVVLMVAIIPIIVKMTAE
jgi:tight adherence protein C